MQFVMYRVFQKSTPLKLFEIFSHWLSRFAWNFANLLTVHIHIYLQCFCRFILIFQEDLTVVKIFQKVLGTTFLKQPVYRQTPYISTFIFLLRTISIYLNTHILYHSSRYVQKASASSGGDFVPQASYRGFAPRSHWGTSVSRTSWLASVYSWPLWGEF